MQCPHCSHHNQAANRFCARCGAALIEVRTPSTLLGQPDDAGRTAQSTLLGQPGGAGRSGRRAVADALLGRTIEGKYRLDTKLGAGGMGAVYQSTRLLIGDQVAVKVLHLDQTADPNATERFRREAQAAARVQHPNAVTIYDFGVSPEGLVYLVMELIAGQSLRQLLQQTGALSPVDAASILGQVCAALDVAHQQEVVHRDIKPDNIIVKATSEGWRVKVLDFGIAKLTNLKAATDQLTLTGSMVGTPHYMSPEQCMGEDLDRRSDIYSLGILLYELLTGVVPFNATTWGAVIVQHVNNPPPPLSARRPELPRAVEAVVLRALAKERTARPQTAGMLARELAAAISGVVEPPSLSPPRGIPITPAPALPLAPSSGSLSRGVPGATPPPAAKGNQAPTQVMKLSAVSGAKRQRDGEPVKPRRTRAPLFVGAAMCLTLLGGGLWWALKPNSEPEPPKLEPPPGMVYVAGGEMLMGNDAGDDYERPAHRMSVKTFFIDKHEVTCEDYQKFIRATGHVAPPDWSSGNYPLGATRRPVTGVTWDDADAYARWAGKRLPTEAEWEFTARGTDGRRYPWGNEWKTGHANADASSLNHLADVGAHPAGASPFGVLDMVGNVWEWTASDLTAYPGGQLPKQTTSGDLKVIRGGAFDIMRQFTTTTYRRGYPARGSDYSRTGFRCVKDLPAGRR
jgi:eukaryotic-like serine/threonine-protein kinase